MHFKPTLSVFLLPMENGFTLIELIITLTVAAVLATIAVPSMRQFVESSRLTTATNDLIADIAFTRIEAMKRGSASQMGMCVSSNGSTCTGATWQAGWMIFVDADVSNSLSAGDTILKTHETLPASLTAAVTPAGTTTLIFERHGAMVPASTNVTVQFNSSSQQRVICLSGATGRAITAASNSTASCT